jgi:DNA ligase 1
MSFQAFSRLIALLDTHSGKLDKIQAMAAYFRLAQPADAAWALFFLSGRRLKRLISSRVLRDIFLLHSGMPDWMYAESYMAIGDTAETISVLGYWLKAKTTYADTMDWSQIALHQVMTEIILPLPLLADKETALLHFWSSLAPFDCFVFNKLISGAFRIGVSQGLLVQAIADVTQLDAGTIQHRLMGQWEPTATFFERLTSSHAQTHADTHPYPFYLASPINLDDLNRFTLSDWQLEWKWDGIRGQLIHRQGVSALWSRGEELISERFPELVTIPLPNGTVLDGEVLAWWDDAPLPFAQLQLRIGRKQVTPALCQQIPVVFQAYDLLEHHGQDCRSWPLSKRRHSLVELVNSVPLPNKLRVSPVLQVSSWDEAAEYRQTARERLVEGLMVKRLDSIYQVGRKRGDWWKWKLDPMTVDAVLTMAQVGHGRRADKFTDYTFAVYNEARELVPIAKAYSGLTDEEIKQLDKWIRQHIVAKFGPVRQVTPLQVFELGFEGIALSPRHKSGIAVRFPRILRWRHDKPVDEIDTVAQLKKLII